ncbi:MAG: GDSL-type esterase/lipase family protein, partial [Saprospiraceae bacterium]
ASGTAGLSGSNGSIGYNGPILSLNQINIVQYNQLLTSPGIIDITPSKVKVNNSISITGVNFSASDQVILGGTTLIPSFNNINGNQIHTVSIPDIGGGFHSVLVKNTSLNSSNVTQCYILPNILSLSQTRVKPGQNILIQGNGFTPNYKVYLNNEQVATNYVDKNSISFTIVRPNSLTLNADGEIIDVKLRDNYNNDSNLVQITLDTYRIYFLGDSIMAGQGHSEDRMFSELISRHLQSQHSDIGVYYTNQAHSGATIESDTANNYSNLDKEIPRSFPSIKSQLNSIINNNSIINQNVEHIILDGGINDMEIMTFLKPSISNQELATRLVQITNLAEQYAYGSMKQLLTKIGQNFPSTNVIVVGYFQVISNKSVAMKLISDYLFYHVAPFLPIGQSIPMLTGFTFSTVVKQCQHAKDELNRCNLRAVVEVNAAFSTNRFKFVIPNFTEDNALFAPDSFLWGFDIFGDVEDPLKSRRDNVCVHPVLQANSDDKTFCRMASVGHPNNKGIQEYFNTISSIM